MDKSSTLKKNIHEVVELVHDNKVLEAVYLLLEREARHENDSLSPLYVASESELNEIEEGLIEAEKGETISHFEVMEEIKRRHNL
ncbi:MAG: hypothetical protein K2Q22_04505 [Cytophagales bacterium]|nr:hypothetical protein [Cytophagales bacterium]